jgi:hypothetical protein
MTDRRSLSVVSLAIAASAGALAQQIADSDKLALPVNVHTALGTLATAATDLADAVDQLAVTHDGTGDTAGLVDRVTRLEQLIAEAGLAPAPASTGTTAEPLNAPLAL